MSKQVPSRKIETITSNEDQVRFEIFSGALPISEAAAELLRVEKCQHEAERRRHRDSVERLSAEIERLRAERDALVIVIMRGSHREARDLARPRFVEMHPEEKGHAAKLARINQQSTPHK